MKSTPEAPGPPGLTSSEPSGVPLAGCRMSASLMLACAGSFQFMGAVTVAHCSPPAHDDRVTTKVPCAEYFPVRDAALLAHATQIDPDGFFFQIPMDLQQAVWPTEDFELVTSLVDSELPEDDLFAGLRGNPAYLADAADGAA